MTLVMPKCVLCSNPVETVEEYLCNECFSDLLADSYIGEREDALEGHD